MMKRYEVMAKSEIGWISDYPIHWGISPLKRITVNCDSQRIPLSSEERGMRGGPFPYYGANGIIDYIDDYIFEGEYVLIGEDGAPFFMRNEDIALIARGKFWVNNHAHILSLISGNHTGFVKYGLNSVDYREYITGSTRDKLTQSDLSRILLLVPPIEEQTEIAKYLDHKTHLIDTLIEKKQKQIELLQEQRAAIINQAVTKGLNPNVKMKDSGIEWLGEVPGHWDSKRLKHIAKIRYGLGQPPKELDGGLPLIRATNIKRGKISENGMIYVDPRAVPYDRNPILKKDEIVVVRSGAYTADSAIIPENYDAAVVGYDMVVTVEAALPKFVSYSLLSKYVLINQLFLKRLRAAQPHLNVEELGEVFILLPSSLDEQKEILGYIESECELVDNLILKAKKVIELLKEYRTTLISEVVTGKIDVRDEGIP